MSSDVIGGSGGVDDLYSRSPEVLARARARLTADGTAPAERAEALWILGRAAYYDNRVAESVQLLAQALPLAEDEGLVAEVLLALAPALSKQGRPDEALAALADDRVASLPAWRGRIHNQRSIILTELGRLPEARSETELAVAALQDAGDLDRAARALVNLAVTASMMGDLDEAERRYEEARELTLATGQPVVAAGIEGNLGYVASRRGDFATALDWYARARRSFDALGVVDLLVAVLEVDHARTLLDVGLAVDAVEASDRASRSASAGGNQMLELQSRLLCAEALIRLGDRRSAIPEIERGIELARSLEHTASQRRIVYLAGEADVDLPGFRAESEVDEILSFIDAGWGREAYEWMLRRARRLRLTDPDAARALIHDAERLTASMDVDPVARATGALLIAAVDGDDESVDRELTRTLDELVEQQELLGSVELRASLASAARGIAEIAIDVGLGRDRAASHVLEVAERVRSVLVRPGGGRRDLLADIDADAARLRDARVALAEAKAGDGDVAAATAAVRAVERDVLRRRRTTGAGSGPTERRRLGPTPTPPAGTVYATHVVHDGRVVGIRHDRSETAMVDLGALDDIVDLGRTQRAALRRLGDRRRRRLAAEIDRVRSTSAELDRRLLRPLELLDADRVVFTPAAQILHLCWSAMPTLESRPLTLATTFHDWADEAEPLVRRLGFIGGPDLDAVADELDEIGRIWARPDAVQHAVDADVAAAMLARADLVHIAAHGSFRSDNVYFSSLVFADRELSILELSDLPRVPAVVVLASCDAGASSTPTGLDDDVAVSTAHELRRLGARVVIAPIVAVNDEAAAEFSVGVHDALAAGRSIDDAVLAVKHGMLASDDPVRMATAWSFNVMGGRSTQQPLRIGR